MEVNVIKLAFLLSYLTMLICLVNGIPFMTALFRSIILMVIFSAIGLVLRWYLLRMVGSIMMVPRPGEPAPEEWDAAEEEAAEELAYVPTEEKLEDVNFPPG